MPRNLSMCLCKYSNTQNAASGHFCLQAALITLFRLAILQKRLSDSIGKKNVRVFCFGLEVDEGWGYRNRRKDVQNGEGRQKLSTQAQVMNLDEASDARMRPFVKVVKRQLEEDKTCANKVKQLTEGQELVHPDDVHGKVLSLF